MEGIADDASATNGAVHTLYSNTCQDSYPDPAVGDNYRARVTNFLPQLKLHVTDIKALTTAIYDHVTNNLEDSPTTHLTTLKASADALKTQAEALLVTLNDIFDPIVIKSKLKSDCRFVKKALLNISKTLPNVTSQLNMLIYVGHGIVGLCGVISIISIMISGVRRVEPKFYEEIQNLEKGGKDKEAERKGPQPLNTNQKEGKAQQAQGQEPVTRGQNRAPSVANTDKYLSVQKKKVQPGSRLYDSRYFNQPAPRPKPLTVQQVEHKLDKMRNEPQKKLKINEVTPEMMDRYRDKGMFQEFHKPLRNYVIEEGKKGLKK